MTLDHAFRLVTSICNECYIQPKVVAKLMRNNLSNTMKYQNKLWSKTFLERLAKSCIGTNEIQNLAFSEFKRTNNLQSFKECIYENMNRKKKSAIKDENSAKMDMIKSKIELKRNVNMNTVAIYPLLDCKSI